MTNEAVRKNFRGVIAPILTPFFPDQLIDFKTLQKFVDWLCQQKINALFPMGGSGEFQTLTVGERKTLIDCIVEVNQNRRLFFAGTGGKNLKETIELSEYALLKGADGVGVIIPEFVKQDEQKLFHYYQSIDRAISIPLMIYDPYGEGHYSITPDLMKKLVENLKNIVGIKYRTVNAELMGKMAYKIGRDISLLSGNEATYLQDLSIGAIGCVGGGASFYPNLMWKLQDYFECGELGKARQIQYQIIDALSVLNKVYWPLSGKIVLQELGIPFQMITRVKGIKYHEKDVQLIRSYYRKLLNL